MIEKTTQDLLDLIESYKTQAEYFRKNWIEVRQEFLRFKTQSEFNQKLLNEFVIRVHVLEVAPPPTEVLKEMEKTSKKEESFQEQATKKLKSYIEHERVLNKVSANILNGDS